ncbi:MAG TPA: hypothetical protein VFP65_00495 [Anaeromyxobacteraceae bacterium]|nr:hypothetical protein [Anaeromyxobacteraceae bacterium]
MRVRWKRTRRRRGLLAAGIALGALMIALPLMPSLRRYVRIETM